jgi:hypothetical protein
MLAEKVIEQARKDLENKILERLAEHGFVFENKEDLFRFALERLEVRVYEDQPDYRQLWLDQKIMIADWKE